MSSMINRINKEKKYNPLKKFTQISYDPYTRMEIIVEEKIGEIIVEEKNNKIESGYYYIRYDKQNIMFGELVSCKYKSYLFKNLSKYVNKSNHKNGVVSIPINLVDIIPMAEILKKLPDVLGRYILEFIVE